MVGQFTTLKHNIQNTNARVVTTVTTCQATDVTVTGAGVITAREHGAVRTMGINNAGRVTDIFTVSAMHAIIMDVIVTMEELSRGINASSMAITLVTGAEDTTSVKPIGRGVGRMVTSTSVTIDVRGSGTTSGDKFYATVVWCLVMVVQQKTNG